MDLEELQESLEPVTEWLSRHKGMLVLLALAAAGAHVYFNVIAHPGSLTVSVKELDGGRLNDAEVTVVDEESGKTLATDLTDGGTVTFYKLPSRKKLQVEVAKGIAFLPETTYAEIPSAGEATADVKLERKNSLSFGASEIPSSVPVGCADEFNVEVRNAGSDNFEAELLVEGGLEGVLSVPEGKKTAYYNSTTNFSVRALVDREPSGGEEDPLTKTGSLRVKKTSRTLPLSIKINPKIQLEVSPPEVRISSSRPRQKITIQLFNSGQQPITGIAFRVNGDADLREACNQNVESCISIEQLGAAQREILSQSKMLVSLIVTPPSQTGKTFLGSLEMTAYCLRKSPVVVPITIEIEQGQ